MITNYSLRDGLRIKYKFKRNERVEWFPGELKYERDQLTDQLEDFIKEGAPRIGHGTFRRIWIWAPMYNERYFNFYEAIEIRTWIINNYTDTGKVKS